LDVRHTETFERERDVPLIAELTVCGERGLEER